MNLFLILKQKLVMSIDFLIDIVQQFSQIASCLLLSILQQTKLYLQRILNNELLYLKYIGSFISQWTWCGITSYASNGFLISKPLSITFRNYLKACNFLAVWKKYNVFSVRRKEKKWFWIIIDLFHLPICRKLLEKIISETIF